MSDLSTILAGNAVMTGADEFPASPNQAQLWLFQELYPESPAYHIPVAIRIKGPVRMEVLQRCISTIFDRHDSFRTVFRIYHGIPVQRVRSDSAPELRVEDLFGSPEDVVSSRLIAEARHPFDLGAGSLWRAVLWRLNAEEHIFQLTAHHIVADGWSMGTIVRELVTLYEAEVTGVGPRLSEVRVRYRDFVARQIAASSDASHMQFWKHELAGIPPLVSMLFDRERPRLPSHHGDVVPVIVPQRSVDGLRSLGRTENTSLFTVLLTALKILIFRLTGQTDNVVGIMSANRRAETASLVGCLVNLLPLRTDLSGDLSVRQALRATRTVMARVLEHEEVPHSAIVKASDSEHGTNYNPIIQFLAVQDCVASEPIACADLEFSYFLVDRARSKFDLTLYVSEKRNGCDLSIEYSKDLFDDSTIRRIARHFETLLDNIATSPDAPISALAILSKSEREDLLFRWNDTGTDFERPATLVELFEEQVRKSPDRMAVSDDSKSLTYIELNSRANQIGHYLRSVGIEAGSCVGIYARRSARLSAGILGVLKSGAAYLPLDPDDPPERIQFMISDARVRFLLIEAELQSSLRFPEVRMISLDEPSSPIDSNPSHCTTPDDPAYAIYTSDSTGALKGVVNHNRGICNRVLWMQDQFRLDSSDRILQKTPIGFDVSVLELFWPIVTGAQLVMARPGGHRDSDYLATVIAEKGITTIHFVPSMLELFLEAANLNRCNGVLRRVLSSGGALSHELQQRFFSRLEATLHNFYGPAEAAVDVTRWICRPDKTTSRVPIGKPIANTQFYVLDSFLEPVPMGVPGEIFISGANVGFGYLAGPEPTADLFISDPFSGKPSQRMFKTGELGRYLGDGSIEFLGRIDRQVKIHGHLSSRTRAPWISRESAEGSCRPIKDE